MFETDRDAYLALAKALQMDFNFLGQIIDGRRQASASFARVLTEATNTWDRLWTTEGKAQERLMTVRVWYAAQKRRPGFQAPEAEPLPARPGCRQCD